VIYNMAIILGAWLLGPTWGVRGLTVGVVVGAAGHLLVQLPGLLSAQRLRYQPALAWRDASLREVGRLMGPRVLGLAAVQLNFLVNAVLAAGLASGSLTALNYGWIIMLLPQGIIAQSVATALFPTLAALAAKEEWAELRRVFILTLRNLLFLTLPAAVGLIILAGPIVRLLLERGAFEPASTAATSWALSFFALGLVGHNVVEIATRAFYALKNTKTPVAIGVAAMGVNIGLSLLLLRLFAGWGWPPHGGLALANSVAVILEMIVLLGLLRPRLGGLAEPGLGQALAKMGLAAGGMALVLWRLRPLIPPEPGWLGGVVGIAIGGLVYLGLAYAFGLDEIKLIRRRLMKKGQFIG
jgi:putative peptidoglycan lipid II flippase